MRKVFSAALLLTLAAPAFSQVPVMSGGGNDIAVDDLSAGGSEKTGGGIVLADDSGQEGGVERMTGGGMVLNAGFIPTALSQEQALIAPNISTPTFSNVFVSSFTLNWTSGTQAQGFNPSGTQYVAQLSTASDFSVINFSSETLNLFAGFTNLDPNTTYYAQAAAFEGASTTTFTDLGSTSTLAALPAAAAANNITMTAIQANWTANNNPDGTIYEAELSSGAFPNSFAGNQASTTLNTNALFSGLDKNTAYFFQVRAVNHSGVFTDFVSLGSASTLDLAVPASFAGSASGVSSITWSWGNVANEDGFRVLSPADANLSGDLAADALSWPETGLSTNTLYNRRVAAFAGTTVSTSTADTAYTLAAPPTGFAFVEVHTTSMTVQWAENTNPAGTTTYRVDRWTAGGSTTSVTIDGTSATITGLTAETTYFLTVQAINGAGILRASGLEISTITLPVSAQETIDPGAGGTVVFNPPSGQVTVDIPPQTFSESVTVTIEVPASFPNVLSPTAQLTGTGVGVEITLDKSVQPARNVTITISYLNSDVAGLDENKLIIARHDTAKGVWVPLFSSVDTAANRVTALTDHFSVFQVMQSNPSDAVAEVKVFPNPFRPSQGHTSVSFIDMPENSRVRIYTFSGELIRDLNANASGMASWDGTNQSGAKVVSGTYFVFIQGAGQKTTVKVAVQR